MTEPDMPLEVIVQRGDIGLEEGIQDEALPVVVWQVVRV